MAPSLDVALTLASAVPLVLLGAALLALRPLRAEPFFLGAFAILWGVQVAALNLGRFLEDASVHEVGVLVSYAVVPPAYLFLAHFATLSRPGARRIALLTPVMALLAILATATLIAAPHLVARVEATGGTIERVALGSAAVALFNAPFYATFYAAVLVLYLQYRAAAPGTARHRARGLLLALALFTSYATAKYLAYYLPEASLLTALFLAGAALLTGLVAHLALRPPAPEGRDRALLAAFLAPAAVALLETAAPTIGLPAVETFGAWRLLAVAALVYALARHQLFDLDLKLKRAVGPALAALALGFALLAAGALWAGGAGSTLALGPLAVGAAVAGGAWAGRGWLGDRLFPDVSDAPDYLYQRRLEVYRAQLELALQSPSVVDPPSLRALRKSLGITEEAHQVMAFMVRQTHGARGTAPAEEAPPRVAPGALLAGRYRVMRLLGEGAHGRAYLAHDEMLDREVAVKAVGTTVLGGRASRLLLREARLSGSLHHPNVVAVHDVIDGAYEAIIVMEFADGGSIHNLLQRKGKLTLQEATAVLDQVLSGLDAAHGKGIIHRDIKPENLLLLRDGTLKVADFGVAREARPDATGLSGGAAGTLLYMSPEQVRGLDDVDARSDLYAAAVVFHQALTGRFYLRIAGKDDFQVRQLILHGAPALGLKDQPPWVAPFLLKALAKERDERFQSAAEMRAALRAHEPLLQASPPATR